MRLPSCLRQAMVHELDGQINVVKAEITKVEAEIDEVKGQLKLVDQQLEENERLGTKDERLSMKGEQLLAEKDRLGVKEDRLRAEKQLLLTAKLQPPGVVPLLFVFIVHAQLASLVAASSALCTRFCLLSLALAAIGFTQPVQTEHCQFKVYHSPPWIGCSAWLCLMRFRREAVAGGASGAGGGGIGAHLPAWPNASRAPAF